MPWRWVKPVARQFARRVTGRWPARAQKGYPMLATTHYALRPGTLDEIEQTVRHGHPPRRGRCNALFRHAGLGRDKLLTSSEIDLTRPACAEFLRSAHGCSAASSRINPLRGCQCASWSRRQRQKATAIWAQPEPDRRRVDLLAGNPLTLRRPSPMPAMPICRPGRTAGRPTDQGAGPFTFNSLGGGE